jgi:hypothetical protein
MYHREGRDCQAFSLPDGPRLDLVKVQLHLYLTTAKDNIHEVADALQSPGATVDSQTSGCFPTGKRGDESPEAQNVVQMAVGEQDFVQAFETQAAAQNLALSSFTAVNKESAILVHDHGGGESTLYRWR